VLQRSPLFAELSDHLLTVLLRRCDVVRPAAGTAVLAEGGRVRCFYVLATGLVTLSVEGDEVATLRAAGATFRNDVVTGPGGRQIVVDDPDGNPIELFEARG